jgi:hypothetical protein
MPSGYTHMLLVKTFPEKSGLKDEDLGLLLDSYMPYFQLGSIGPDLPYSQEVFSVTDRKEVKIADKFHYEKTTEIPLRAFELIKTLNEEQKDQAFAFILGFVAHIVADGLIHPYVRDKVGDYTNNKDAHRMLEMRLDVFFLDYLTNGNGKSLNLNHTNMHDQILDSLENFSHVSKLFAKVVSEVHQVELSSSTVEEWARDMHKIFEVAENSNNQFYAKFPGAAGYLFKDKDEVLKNHQSDLLLRADEAKGRERNFAGRDIHFFNDCVPSFYKVFKAIALKAYSYVYSNGAALNPADFPAINLDTGRPLIAGNDLNQKAPYWGLA